MLLMVRHSQGFIITVEAALAATGGDGSVVSFHRQVVPCGMGRHRERNITEVIGSLKYLLAIG